MIRQASPSPDLRKWLRDEMARRTGQVRLYYDSEAYAKPE